MKYRNKEYDEKVTDGDVTYYKLKGKVVLKHTDIEAQKARRINYIDNLDLNGVKFELKRMKGLL